MTVAAFVLGVLGFGVAIASLTWQVITFRLQGARPKLTPVVGLLYPGRIITNNATRDVRASLDSAAKQMGRGRLIIGVELVNAGRAPFHVANWEIRAREIGIAIKDIGGQLGSHAVPCDIAPGAGQTFFMDLEEVKSLKAAADHVGGKPNQIVVTVSSGGRSYVSKPIAAQNLTIGSQGTQ